MVADICYICISRYATHKFVTLKHLDLDLDLGHI